MQVKKATVCKCDEPYRRYGDKEISLGKTSEITLLADDAAVAPLYQALTLADIKVCILCMCHRLYVP